MSISPNQNHTLLTNDSNPVEQFDGKWETKRLDQVADCLDNVRIPLNEAQRASIPGPYPYCGANGVLDYVNDFVLDDDVILIAEDGGYFDEYTDRPIAYRMKGKIWVNNHAHVLKAKNHHNQGFLYYSLAHKNILPYLSGGTRAKLNRSEMNKIELNLPHETSEQRAIAEVLSDVDGLIGALDALIAKKRAIKQAIMQQLLTGKTRLPGFSGEWETKQIGDVVSLCSEKNNLGADIPVLTCSKHLGFVDSLSYFKNQVFSKDLSSYKIIRRGQIGYPINHVEEGSIGLQDLHDVALVSPIYVVCSPKKCVNSFFLHRLLKLESYRQEFANATTSSINRRGSLRWPAFSKIHVTLPPIDEQVAVAAVLNDLETEIVALEKRREKTRAIKQGMMQQILTRRVRLVKSDAVP